MSDYGLKKDVWVFADASAAIGIARRKGLGKVRHLDTQCLWIQDAVRERRIGLEKVAGVVHPVDAMTKHLDFGTLDRHLKKMCVLKEDGRASLAPKLAGTEEVQNVEGKEKTRKR